MARTVSSRSRRDANGELDGGLVRPDFKGPGSKSRRPTKEEVARSSVLSPARNAVLHHVVGYTQKRFGKHIGVHRRVREHGGRMHVSLCTALLYLDRTSHAIDGRNASESVPSGRCSASPSRTSVS